ncbi:MAG TPA: ROK family protein [Pirellulales bacterium]|jgi:predicted NBD/HSP70 family sugar kinase|nr:ROK family protein [Pirellulales bacterium]
MKKTVIKPTAVADLESTMIRAVRTRGATSRVELARDLSLVASTAGLYVDRLIQRGYLVESTRTTRGLGRPPVLVELNPAGGRFIGLDFDARQMMVATVDLAQQPQEQIRRKIPARAAADRVLTMIEDLLDEVLGSRRRDVQGIGLGVPGKIDYQRGVSLQYDFIPGWQNIAIGPRIAKRFRLPVFVENNVRSMAIGELWSGPRRGLRDLVCLGIRSGIGTGIIAGKKLLGGANNLAGEIGRWACPGLPAGRRRASVLRSPHRPQETIEDVASLTAMLQATSEQLGRGRKSILGRPGNTPTAGELVAAANEDDELALAIIREAAQIHGWIVHQLTLLLDPERVFIAGPLIEARNYIETVRRAAIKLGSTVREDGAALGTRIVASTLGPFGGALGAAALAFHHWTPRR